MDQGVVSTIACSFLWMKNALCSVLALSGVRIRYLVSGNWLHWAAGCCQPVKTGVARLKILRTYIFSFAIPPLLIFTQNGQLVKTGAESDSNFIGWQSMKKDQENRQIPYKDYLSEFQRQRRDSCVRRRGASLRYHASLWKAIRCA